MLLRTTALLAGLGFCALAQATSTHYPLTLENCGSTLTFQQAPARSVTIGQAATEMLYALGVGDTVVGTSLWFNNVMPSFKAQNDKIPRAWPTTSPASKPSSPSARNWWPPSWNGWSARKAWSVPASNFMS